MKKYLKKTLNGFVLEIDEAEAAAELADAIDEFTPINCLEIRWSRFGSRRWAYLILSPQQPGMTKAECETHLKNVLESIELRLKIKQENKLKKN